MVTDSPPVRFTQAPLALHCYHCLHQEVIMHYLQLQIQTQLSPLAVEEMKAKAAQAAALHRALFSMLKTKDGTKTQWVRCRSRDPIMQL